MLSLGQDAVLGEPDIGESGNELNDCAFELSWSLHAAVGDNSGASPSSSSRHSAYPVSSHGSHDPESYGSCEVGEGVPTLTFSEALQHKDNNQSDRTTPLLHGPLTTHIDIPGSIAEYRKLPLSG
ncbi:unnamed protein product [Prorocentrum cordatum]|uniref:Uncharacterized protein n=1 Tax=Prorocentrum cordatum TaxID=2364126 RepID=A0ABN9X9E2_9DINO|nr:unnamed protein product [Polarella glacialis]